jgi:hypothetical protein
MVTAIFLILRKNPIFLNWEISTFCDLSQYIATKADILEKLMIIITNNVKVLNI